MQLRVRNQHGLRTRRQAARTEPRVLHEVRDAELRLHVSGRRRRQEAVVPRRARPPPGARHQLLRHSRAERTFSIVSVASRAQPSRINGSRLRPPRKHALLMACWQADSNPRPAAPPQADNDVLSCSISSTPVRRHAYGGLQVLSRWCLCECLLVGV